MAIDGCLPFTSQTHLVSNCANGTQTFRLENPVRSTRFPFPVRKKPEIYRKGPGARWKTQKHVNGTK